MQFLLIVISACFPQLIVAAEPDIGVIGVQLNSNEHAGTGNLNLTLWWNHTVYSCTMYNLYVRSCDDCEWQWCEPTQIGEVCNEKYQILLDNSDTADAPIIDSIVVWLSHPRTYYHISGWCIHNETVTNAFTNIEDWELKGADNQCLGMRNFQTLCLDNQPTDCSFGKMMLYFDPKMQNATRWDSPLEDAANVTVENVTCSPNADPTISLTGSPIKSPSREPTDIPTIYPLSEPTTDPSDFPTGYPSHIITVRRSPSPETTQPSYFPTNIMTGNPSNVPTTALKRQSDDTDISSLFFIIFGGSCAICGFCICFFFCLYDRNKRMTKLKAQKRRVKSQSISPEIDLMVNASEHDLCNQRSISEVSSAASLLYVPNGAVMDLTDQVSPGTPSANAAMTAGEEAVSTDESDEEIIGACIESRGETSGPNDV